MEFPQYRKYPNDKSFFRIESPEAFTELKRMGSKHYSIHHQRAEIHPDRMYIMDMLQMQDAHWVISTQSEFETHLRECEENGILF
jgi:hypothetical protein